MNVSKKKTNRQITSMEAELTNADPLSTFVSVLMLHHGLKYIGLNPSDI